MKTSRQEPVFFLEMPHSLRHMIMRRGLMLRGGCTRTLCCMSKGGAKAWLEAKLIVNPGESGEENWDKAHELSGKFRAQLHTDIYIEPAGQYGRFNELASPSLPGESDSQINILPTGVGHDFGNGAAIDGSTFASGVPGTFGNRFGMGHNSGHGSPFAPGKMNVPGMPHIPDPVKDLIPPQVRQIIGKNPPSTFDIQKRVDLIFPALRSLPGWSELPENKRKMFEVEAAQLRDSGYFCLTSEAETGIPALPQDAAGNQRALAAVTVHPKISAPLKRFLLESFEAATSQSDNSENT